MIYGIYAALIAFVVMFLICLFLGFASGAMKSFFLYSLGAAVAFFLLFAPTEVISDNADDYFKYSTPKTESYAIAGNSTGSYFNVSNKKTSVLVLGKDGTSHIKSYNNDIVTCKQSDEDPKVVVTYKVVKKRSLKERIIYGNIWEKGGTKKVTKVEIVYPEEKTN